MGYSTHMTSESSVEVLYENIRTRFGNVDVLINDAITLNNQDTGDIQPVLWWHDFVSHPSQREKQRFGVVSDRIRPGMPRQRSLLDEPLLHQVFRGDRDYHQYLFIGHWTCDARIQFLFGQ